jgi:hypothetical protein
MINIVRPDRPSIDPKAPCKLCEAMRQMHADFMRRIGLMPRNKTFVKNEPPTITVEKKL